MDRYRNRNAMQNEEELPYYQPEQPGQYEQYPYEEEYYEQEPYQQYQPQQPQYHPSELSPSVEPPSNKSPLSILDEIKNAPTPKGAHKTIIGGVPVDLHALEDYIIRISPYNIKTLMRYHNARTLEEIKGYSKFGGFKMNTKSIILIIAAIAMALLGIFFIFFMPKIMAGLQGGMGV